MELPNYTHMLALGHVSAYVFHKCCWGIFINTTTSIGGEAFNSLLKTFFFHHTQWGRSINGERQREQRQGLFQLQWLQKRIMWLCTYDSNTNFEWGVMQMLHL
jgi:hypothetical protein